MAHSANDGRGQLKNRFIRTLLFLGLLATAPAVAADAAALCPTLLRIAWFDSHPYHYRDEIGIVTGLDIEILTRVLDRAGCRYGFVEMPLKRLLTAIRHGQADVAMGASRTPEREGYARFSAPYRRELVVMFMRAGEADRFRPSRLGDIVGAGLNVGVLIGSWYGSEFDYLIGNDPAFKARVLQASDYDMLFRGLQHGRVDIVINDLFNGADMLRERNQLAAVAVHPRIVNDDITYFMFSGKTVSAAFLARFDTILTEFEKSPEFTAAAQKYVPDNFLQYLPVQRAEPALPPKIGDGGAPVMAGR